MKNKSEIVGAIILTFIINLCGIPFCFSTSNQYPTIALATSFVSYTILGVYGIFIMGNKEKV